jgi:hypothetical protein
MCEDFASNFDNKELAVASRQCTSHFIFHQGIFDQKQNHCHPPSIYLTFLFSRLKIKLKGRHFDGTEVIETESQAVLNTLTEHDFHDAFKKRQKGWKGAYSRKGTFSRVMVTSRPKVSF